MRAWKTVLALAAIAIAGCGSSSGGGARARALRAEGRRVFVAAACGSCHTLAAAGAHGRFGPDFDTSERLSRRQIRTQLEYGAGGMPSYARRLTAREKAAVTEFVYAATHGRRK
jgi:mono/diheme cytochrome c family protein